MHLNWQFSPRADRATYFAAKISSFLIGDQLSHDLLDRFSHFFSPNCKYLIEHHGSGPIFPIALGTLPRQPILGQHLQMTFIRHAGVPKRNGISERRWPHKQRNELAYILTQEITWLTCVSVWKKNWKNSVYSTIPPNISESTGPMVTKFS